LKLARFSNVLRVTTNRLLFLQIFQKFSGCKPVINFFYYTSEARPTPCFIFYMPCLAQQAIQRPIEKSYCLLCSVWQEAACFLANCQSCFLQTVDNIFHTYFRYFTGINNFLAGRICEREYDLDLFFGVGKQ